MADLKFEVKIDFGEIGGKKKLTFTSWNGNAPRYDIRDWYDDEKCGKGITLDKSELKSLFELLKEMYETPEEEVEEEVEEDIEEQETEEEQTTLFDNIKESKEDITYPKAIQKIFKSLDSFFEDFETEKQYGKMPFADGERLQYLVHKSDDDYPDYEELLEALELKSFITNKGNLYIYTL